MPFYDYFCQENGKTVEVYHDIRTRLKTWGEVCQTVGIDPGKTSAKAAVVRLISGITPTVFRLKGLDKDAPSSKLEL